MRENTVNNNTSNINVKRKMLSDDDPSELALSDTSVSIMNAFDSPLAMDILGLKHHSTEIK